MKNKTFLLMLGFLIVGIFNLQAQKVVLADVPASVIKAFDSAFSDATDKEWKNYGENYQVSFEIKDVDHKATYDAAGNNISYQKKIPVSALPGVIAKHVKTNYPKATIDDVVWKNSTGKITYKVDLDGTPDLALWYAENGTLLKATAD